MRASDWLHKCVLEEPAISSGAKAHANIGPGRRGSTGCRKTVLRGVILSVAKDLLFARAENKADPSVAQNRRDLRMTLLRVFQRPLKARPFKEIFMQPVLGPRLYCKAQLRIGEP
jgi:hypothetical protein